MRKSYGIVNKVRRTELTNSLTFIRGERRKEVILENLIVASEVIAMLRISPSTLDRYICQARCGNSSFPLPLQYGARGKRLWRKSDFEHLTKGYELQGNQMLQKP